MIELRVPPALRERLAAMLRITDDVASDHLDEEYRNLAHLAGDALATAVGVPQATLTNKARAVRDLRRLKLLDWEFSRREHLTDPLTTSFFRSSTIR